MKIYFAGSIRGGRGDREIYLEIITLLKEYGQVLTEHIGHGTLTHMGQTDLTNEEIYTKDTDWIRESNVVVAEVTTPSLGVGYELGFAEGIQKKIIALYRNLPDRGISAMVSGNKYIECVEYKEVGELKEVFDRVLK